MISWIKGLFSKKPVAETVGWRDQPGVRIAIVDHCNTPLADLKAYAAAQLVQANQQFGLPPPVGYGVRVAYVRVVQNVQPLPDEWVLGLFMTADQPGALGYHDVTPQGLPIMKVFPPLDAQDGVAWQTTASHEVLETLADPLLRTAAQDAQGRFWALEVADAVEQDQYLVNNVPVSNFCTPLYFEPSSDLSKAKLDWMGLVKAPFEVRPGGYAQCYDPAQGWVQVGPTAMRPGRKARGTHSRSLRRRLK